MTIEQACKAMMERKKFWDSERNRVCWISAVECRGSVEISFGDDERPRAVWLWLHEASRFGEVE